MLKRPLLKFLLVSLFFLAAIFGVVSVASAQTKLPSIDIRSTGDVVNILNRILGFVYQIIGILAVIVILYSAALFMTSGDNEDRRKKAISYLKWGIAGIIVAILAGSIITLVTSVLQGG